MEKDCAPAPPGLIISQVPLIVLLFKLSSSLVADLCPWHCWDPGISVTFEGQSTWMQNEPLDTRDAPFIAEDWYAFVFFRQEKLC